MLKMIGFGGLEIVGDNLMSTVLYHLESHLTQLISFCPGFRLTLFRSLGIFLDPGKAQLLKKVLKFFIFRINTCRMCEPNIPEFSAQKRQFPATRSHPQSRGTYPAVEAKGCERCVMRRGKAWHGTLLEVKHPPWLFPKACPILWLVGNDQDESYAMDLHLVTGRA